MSAKKKVENRVEEAIASVENTLKVLREEYSTNPSNPLYSILIAQELSLKELKSLDTHE